MRLPTQGRQADDRGVIRNGRDAGTKSNYIPIIPQDLAKAYKAFNAKLTPQQRAALNIHSDANPTGEIKPLHKEDEFTQLDSLDDPRGQRGCPRNLWLAPMDAAQAIEPSEAESQGPSGFLHIIAVLAILRRVLRIYEVSGQQDQAVRLHGECVAVALGIPGFTTSQVARTYGVTKQAVSKRVRVISQALELPAAYRTHLATLPRGAGVCLKGSTHPHQSKPATSQDKGQGSPTRQGNAHPPAKPGASKQPK